MAGKKENIKALFTNTRTRVIIIFTAFLLMLAVGIGYLKLRVISQSSTAASQLNTAPGAIQSIPGAINQTAQYAKLQQEQNITQAHQAEKTGASAIPTIIRTQAIGEGVGVIGSQNGKSGVGFEALSRENQSGGYKSLWLQTLQDSGCSKSAIATVVSQGAQLSDLKAACSCVQLKDGGYGLNELKSVCSCPELKAAGFNARQLTDSGLTTERLKECGFNACELRNAGATAQEMKDAGFSDGELKGAGFNDNEIKNASGLPEGITADDVRNAGCGADALSRLRNEGVTASAIRRISGCTDQQLKAAGYSAGDLRSAGYSAADAKDAGYAPDAIKAAGYTPQEISEATPMTPERIKAIGQIANCNVDSLKKAKANGVSAATIVKTLGCSAEALKAAGYSAKDLKDAGFTAAELKKAGFSAKDLKDAGYSAKELKDAGFTAAQLKNAGFSAKDLKDAGFSAKQLKDAGFSAAQLKNAGFSAKDLKDAGFTAAELKNAGFSAKELQDAGFPESQVAALNPPNLLPGVDSSVSPIPSLERPKTPGIESSNQQLQAILQKQNQQMAEQKYQQKIQQRTSDMLSAANQMLNEWKVVSQQVNVTGTKVEKKSATGAAVEGMQAAAGQAAGGGSGLAAMNKPAIIKTGDVLFAVMDTSVNSDEPGPILATIITGKLKGTKLIGSFTKPANANTMVITFNTMSVPGAAKSTSIAAYAIDPNTARTALASKSNSHFLMRYGSLFASSFLEGFGNAFQSANTTVTIGGSGGGNNITVSNGVGRSTLENAVIGLSTVGKSWGQQAQQLFNTPTTVEVYSGTAMGVLFTQDVRTI